MRFIYPEFLPAVAFVIIPILIHFLRFRHFKTVYFSQVNFLRAVKQKSQRRNNLKQLLILLSRMLTITALVFVFSQPYLPANKQTRRISRNLVAVYVDNSFSMKNESEAGTLLESAKNKAISIVQSYGPGTGFLLMDNQNTPDKQQLLNKSQFISRLAAIKEAPGSINISKAYQLLLNSLLKQQLKSEKTIWLISDFQEFISDFHEIGPDTGSQTFLIPLKAQANNNLLIDSCWFETPGHKKEREETLFVSIQNLSSQSYQNIPVRLKINDTIKAINNLNIDANSKKEFEFIYKNNRAGTHCGVVELDDYPMVHDNQFYFSYEVRDKNNVLVIGQSDDPARTYLEALFREDENIIFAETGPTKIQVGQLPDYQCIFLVNIRNPGTGLTAALARFVQSGGTLAVFPGKAANTSAYNELYQSLQVGLMLQADSSTLRMAKVNFNHPLLQNVFRHEKNKPALPSVSYSYRYSNTTTANQERIVEFNNTQPAISGFQFENGRLYNFNFPLRESTTDFNQHAIFVPLVYNIALNSSEAQQIQYEARNNLVLTLPKKRNLTNIQSIALISEKSKEKIRLSFLNEFAGQIRINLQNIITEAGFYELLINDLSYRTLAFNFNRNESLSKQMTSGQLQTALETANLKSFNVIDSNHSVFEQQIQEANDGIELWQLFLVLTLLFMAVEIVITRFGK